MLTKIKIELLPYIIYFIYRLYMFTVKYKEPPFPEEIQRIIKEGGNYIVAHFHQDELVLIERRRNSNFSVMTSTSIDGEIMTRFLEMMGYHCVRGSTTRGGTNALIQLIHSVNKNNHNAVMAVDGPRGPIYKVKNGTLILAKKTGCPILPVGISISRSFCFKKSWNKVLLPLPFSTVEIKFGNTIWVPDNIRDEKIETVRKKLEQELLKFKKYKNLVQ